MVYDIDKVMRDVRVCLDQNMESEALLSEGDVDTLSLDEIVRSKIEEAAKRVELEAPVHLLELGHNLDNAVHWGDLQSGWVLLPDDFMRLVVFEMSDWERSVYTAISGDDAEYALQRQRVKALRGTAQKPVCAIVTRPEGRALEFYSCKSEDAYVRRGVYIPWPKVNAYGCIDISERCYRAVVLMAASLVMATLGDTAKANMMNELTKTALQ